MFNLTKEEKQVVLFLMVLALAGAGINYLSKRFLPVRRIACVNPDLGKININTADKLALKLIPGVGEKIAQRIIDYRQQNKGFDAPEELKQVKGINNRTWERARGMIVIQ